MSRFALFEVKSLFSVSILGLSILASSQAKADMISNGNFGTGNLSDRRHSLPQTAPTALACR
jgi:hypothetical protein